MKYMFRMIAFNIFSLWMTTQIVSGFIISGQLWGLFIAGLILTILNLLVKPLLKILFIPINIMTFGLLSWVINVIVLYILTIIFPAVIITPWTYQGANLSGFIIPAMRFSYIATISIVSIVATGVSNILHYVSED